MANTFLRKISRNIGTSLTAVGSYTVGANVGAVIVGLNISNTSAAQVIANVVINNGADDFYLTHRIPIADGGAVSIAGGDQKIILQTGDSVQVNSSAASSLDVLMNIMETDGVGLTVDGGGGPTAAYDATDPTDFTFFAYGPPDTPGGPFDVIVDAGSALHTFLSTTDITGYTVDVYEGATVFNQTVISRTNPTAQYWQIKVSFFSTVTGTATRLVFFAP